RFACDGVRAAQMAWGSFRAAAGRLCDRKFARRRRVLDRVSALGLASDVFHWGRACAADADYSPARPRERFVESASRTEKELGRLFQSARGELEEIFVSRVIDGDD